MSLRVLLQPPCKGSMEPPTYTLEDTEGYLGYLQEHGYVVIESILPQETREELMEKFWKDWTTCSPGFKREDTSTWTPENSPMMFAKGMALFSGLPHGDFAWSTRTQPNIRKVFEKVHGTNKLSVSFDGFSVFFSNKQKTPKWLHTDQNPANTEYSVQGALNFLPVTEKSAGFIVVPGSHKDQRTAKTKLDWVPVEDDLRAVKLLIPENCLTLWNSRTVHANTGYTGKETKLDRLTCYITWCPRASREIQREKIKAYWAAKGTSHWANRCEVKKYPWGFGPLYESRNFNTLTTSEDIPEDRLRCF